MITDDELIQEFSQRKKEFYLLDQYVFKTIIRKKNKIIKQVFTFRFFVKFMG